MYCRDDTLFTYEDMGMRILIINPFGGSEPYARENFDRIKRPDTE